VILLCGCHGGGKDESVSRLRKSGQSQAARTRAVELLGEDADRMAVWRELAGCDVDLARTSNCTVEARRKLLLEAALICAGVGAHGQGQYDAEWRTVGLVVASELVSLGGHITNALNFPNADVQSNGATEEFLSDLDDAEEIPPLYPQEPPQRYTDPVFVRELVSQTSLVLELLKVLPYDNPTLLEQTMVQLDRQMTLNAGRAGTPRSDIMAWGKAAQTAATRAVDAAASELESQGYFNAETIFQSRILDL
jgi:hypothetical protein